jgi:hypothetical protein
VVALPPAVTAALAPVLAVLAPVLLLLMSVVKLVVDMLVRGGQGLSRPTQRPIRCGDAHQNQRTPVHFST